MTPLNQSQKQVVHNYATKAFYENNTGSFDIFTYFDIDKCMTIEDIKSILKTIVAKNPILKQYLQKDGETLFLVEDTTFDIENYYSIQHSTKDEFENTVPGFLNAPFTTPCKWKALYIIDTNANKSRCNFKIDHAYADGYKVIKILTSAFTDEDPTKKFKHSTSFFYSIYMLVFGTFLLLNLNVKFIVKCLTSEIQENYSLRETDTISCDSFSLQEIKTITKKYNITVNDFLYACMVKTDYLYTGSTRQITSASPINTSRSKDLNNIMPLFLSIQTDLEPPFLFRKVHTMFDACKYSAFIPFLSGLIQVFIPLVSLKFLNLCYDNVLSNCDYVYSNIIGPDLDTISIPVTDIHFATVAKNREIVFNIISCKDKVNIVCSFKKGRITDKERFRSCIEQAYKSLLTS